MFFFNKIAAAGRPASNRLTQFKIFSWPEAETELTAAWNWASNWDKNKYFLAQTKPASSTASQWHVSAEDMFRSSFWVLSLTVIWQELLAKMQKV